jgi:short-subunit dehydrogenase
VKVVVITGACDACCAETARRWAARDGSRELALVLTARSADKLEAVAAECRIARHAGADAAVRRCVPLRETALSARVHT